MITSEDVISIKNLHKHFDLSVHVLKGVNLAVKKGQLVSVIGRSGCGKTTLLRCINCLEAFDEGTIRVAGITINIDSRKVNNHHRKKFRQQTHTPFELAGGDESDEDFRVKAQTLRQRVGMVFQNLNLFPHFNVLENVLLAPTIVRKEPRNLATIRAVQLLDKVGLGDFVKRYPHELSGGQAQRVAIARCLAMSPQVILYDEPTSALDPELVEEVLQVMRNLHNDGLTQIVVTHKMSFAREASDLIVFMDDGRIVEFGPPAQIFANPADSRTKQYLSIFKD
jgi:polar amino acid transport system ATP-binding protein